MFFTDIIFDLDNTLYNYNCHNIAIELTIKKLSLDYSNKYDDIKSDYDLISNKLKYEIGNTASSHNRTIYFKQVFDKYNFPLCDLMNIVEYYWESYFYNLKINDGVIQLLKFVKENNIKIHILSDFTLLEQLKKLKILNILEFIDNIITSEEIGIEKPSLKVFTYCINKLKLNVDKTIFIGDDFEKDILGANNVGIYAFYYSNKNLTFNKNYATFNSFIELLDIFKNIKSSLKELELISKYYGQRFDLVQAGGGNISIKTNDLMIIKSSGCLLSDVSTISNYTIINNQKLKLEMSRYNNLSDYILFNGDIPSMETYMHSILKKYTIHLHPIQIINMFKKQDVLKILFNNSLIIEYFTPGEELSDGIMKNYNNNDIIFLLNHGVIFTSDNYNDLFNLIEKCLNKIEEYLNLNFCKYKYVNDISNVIGNITYLSEDKIIIDNLQKLKKFKIIFPDQLIYCGENILFIEKLNECKPSKIIVYNDNVYINSENLNKCRHIESVLKSYLLLDYNNSLSEIDIQKLNNSNMEKYRKNKQ